MYRVYREHSENWEGPFKVVRLVAKYVSITYGKKVKAFPRSDVIQIPAQCRDPDLHRTIKEISNDGAIKVHLVEYLHPHDTRAESHPCREGVKRENDGLLEKGVFEVVP